MLEKDKDFKIFVNCRLPPFYTKHPGRVSSKTILEGVRSGLFFGMLEVDIHVPDHLYEHFSEMSPLFCTTDVPFSSIGPYMQSYGIKENVSTKPRRLLVGGMRAEKILLASALVAWYLSHGLVVSNIYTALEFTPKKCFVDFVNTVTQGRRQGDLDNDKKMLASMYKMVGNTAYGSTLLNKEKHKKISFIHGSSAAFKQVNFPMFRDLTVLGDESMENYEIESAKRKICVDTPLTIGYFVLSYSKMRMLRFYYDFLCNTREETR